jgi:TrpR family transcriptional regulator, trp operon repressor
MPEQKNLAAVFSSITDPDQMGQFFEEIFSPKEIEDFSLRWQLLNDLYLGDSQRSIAAKHRISLCKITRGSKILKQNGSISRKLLETMHGGDDEYKAE